MFLIRVQFATFAAAIKLLPLGQRRGYSTEKHSSGYSSNAAA